MAILLAASPQPVPDAPQAIRVLILSPCHPALMPDRAADLALRLHMALQATPGVQSLFLANGAGGPPPPPGVRLWQPFGADQYLCATRGFDHGLMQSRDIGFPAAFAAMLQHWAPDVVHVTDLQDFGPELLYWLRQLRPGARILVELHGRAGCDQLEPLIRPGQDDHFLRGLLLRRFLPLADQLLVASEQLAAQYAACGLPAARLQIMAPASIRPDSVLTRQPGRQLRLGVFGPLGGAGDLLAAALRQWAGSAAIRRRLRLQLCCDPCGRDAVPPEAMAQWAAESGGILALEPWPAPGLGAEGPAAALAAMMQACDAVLLPGGSGAQALWHVAQALQLRRPLLWARTPELMACCQQGRDGFGFQPASPAALVALIERLLRQPQLLSALGASLPQPADPAAQLAQILALYRQKSSDPAGSSWRI